MAALPTYGTDFSARNVWGWFEAVLHPDDGIAYYKHPIVGSSSGSQPDLTILARPYQPVVVTSIRYRLDDIVTVNAQEWVINDAGENRTIDSPLLELDDFVVGLQQKFDKERTIRRLLNVVGLVSFPIIAAADFRAKFNMELDNAIWRAEDVRAALVRHVNPLSDREWKTAKSVMQSATPLNKIGGPLPRTTTRLGDAIRILESDIANLDLEQEKVATQIPPGPQRIRGLAGTGKTVLLAMKAANIHRQLPDKKILFTFNTQSLYNQCKTLISKFYRHFSDVDPDWSRVHIRHAWGGRARPGVYYDTCARQGAVPLDFRTAKATDPEVPFRACCVSALQGHVEAEYDYILVDEAQDFPKEYFQLLYRLSGDQHAIFWAYDELQSLASVEMPNTAELFGRDAAGNPLVSLDGDYPGGIEKDFVLHKSYRCPLKVLVLAHAIGLGIHSPNGPVQMLGRPDSWRSIGYEVDADAFAEGQDVVVTRPAENSPNRLETIYTGDQSLITTAVFDDRPSELDWVAESIRKDIREQGVAPEEIIVISLDSPRAKKLMSSLQIRLQSHSIASTIPGLVDGSAEFGEPGRVTLSTVFRAKGNEAPVVYILSFDSLYDYVQEIENRNRAFTCISRSKGWVRITGYGENMVRAQAEINTILVDIPRLRFKFPNMQRIHNLDAETSRRRREMKKAKEAATGLIETDAEALKNLDAKVQQQLLKKLLEADALKDVGQEVRKELLKKVGGQ